MRGDQENLPYMALRDLFIGYYCPLMPKSNIAILRSYSVAVSKNYEIILYFLYYRIAVFPSYDIRLSIFALYTLH